MRSKRRRRLDVILAIAAAGIVLIVAGIGAAAGDREHITRMTVSGTMDPSDGDLAVTEWIDYDFGLTPRHGIYRDIPDVNEAAEISVSSDTAPDDVLVTPFGSQVRIRVGDPARTISRLHRYRIDYRLHGDAVVDESTGQFAWNAIGPDWTVPIDTAAIMLTTPFELAEVVCGQTGTFTPADCDLDRVGPGTIRFGIADLSPGTGLTIVGRIGAGVEVDTASAIGVPELDDPGTGLVPPALLAGLAALLGAIPAAVIVRWAGREQVWAGGAADAAHGPRDETQLERMTEADLADLATTEFESPRGMSAVEGGIIIDERVLDRHKSAWLLESAIRDEIEIDDTGEDLTLRLGSAPAHPQSAQILGAMFGSREKIDLGSYDSKFEKGWDRLGSELQGWRRDSDHWDPRHRKVKRLAVGGGVVMVLLGLVVAFIGGWNANRWGDYLALAAVGGAVYGFGMALVVRSWELHVRTPEGSARWLQIESFRRFLHDSEAHHVEQAAERGLLRQYTAWAVALNETDAWTDAVEAAAAADPQLRSSLGHDIAFATSASSFSRATGVASTSPSSSGGGGGGGGFSGGGGGGGGSW
jgi:uncharacterized membrane protein YgcG